MNRPVTEPPTHTSFQQRTEEPRSGDQLLKVYVGHWLPYYKSTAQFRLGNLPLAQAPISQSVYEG